MSSAGLTSKQSKLGALQIYENFNFLENLPKFLQIWGLLYFL